MAFNFSVAAASTLSRTKTHHPPPARHYSAKQPKNLDASTTSNNFISNVSIKLPHQKSTDDPAIQNRIAPLFATMQQVDATLAILPLNHKSLLPLLSGPSLPQEHDLYNKYTTVPFIDLRSSKIHLYFQSTKKFNEIKFNLFVLNHLNKHRIWVETHKIQSHDVTQVGWAADKHPEYLSKS